MRFKYDWMVTLFHWIHIRHSCCYRSDSYCCNNTCILILMFFMLSHEKAYFLFLQIITEIICWPNNKLLFIGSFMAKIIARLFEYLNGGNSTKCDLYKQKPNFLWSLFDTMLPTMCALLNEEQNHFTSAIIW